MSDEQRQVLSQLAVWLGDNGFNGMDDAVYEFVDTDGKGWRSPTEFLVASRQDVWWHFGHVGEDEDRHLYEAADRRVSEAIYAIGARS